MSGVASREPAPCAQTCRWRGQWCDQSYERQSDSSTTGDLGSLGIGSKPSSRGRMAILTSTAIPVNTKEKFYHGLMKMGNLASRAGFEPTVCANHHTIEAP